MKRPTFAKPNRKPWIIVVCVTLFLVILFTFEDILLLMVARWLIRRMGDGSQRAWTR